MGQVRCSLSLPRWVPRRLPPSKVQAAMAVTKTTTPPHFKRTARSRRVSTPLTDAGVARGKREKRAVEEAEASSVAGAASCGAALVVPRPLSPPSELAILPAEFFLADALDLAPRLLGKLLRRDDVTLRITEVEAYRPNDTACHGRFGVTARTAPLFGPGGHAYVYMCYGIHMMLNVVADKEGVGAAVLIRSCSPVTGLKTIQQRRGQKTDKPVLLAGPGKVGKALGLSTAWSSHPLYITGVLKPTSVSYLPCTLGSFVLNSHEVISGGLELLDGPAPEKVLVGPRIGIEYASPEHAAAPWRFAIADSPWISSPKNTLRSP
ncbi:hypothetical protein Taro_032975 [Colocasia esculenta]|uniref:DNA-3-methyladenine glycosylase II n=1 Tax=Colocasia esculenta TaxID=4460 RepID=A0A843W5J3_COLES|nr:hypothetical protein [Colocasia esculenta]